MPFDLSPILHFLGQALLASAATIILASTKLGEKLFSHHFDRRLTKLKHEHDLAIEGLRSQLAHIGDRGKHSNQREFEALSAIWERFIAAFLSTNTAVMRFMEYPDLNRMTQEAATAFLNSTEFSETQKAQIAAASDKNKLFSRVVELRYLNKARQDIFDTRLLVRQRGIFVPEKLVQQFEEAIGILNAAEVERYVAFQHESASLYEAQSKLLKDGDQIVRELGAAVRTRLLKTD